MGGNVESEAKRRKLNPLAAEFHSAESEGSTPQAVDTPGATSPTIEVRKSISDCKAFEAPKADPEAPTAEAETACTSMEVEAAAEAGKLATEAPTSEQAAPTEVAEDSAETSAELQSEGE